MASLDPSTSQTTSSIVTSLEDAPKECTIKLISKDNKEFVLERKFTFISNLVKTSLESDTSSTEVPIPSVTGDVLSLVVDYMNHHQGTELPIIEKPLRSKIMKDICKDPWDAEFIDKIADDLAAMYNLILAANYMDIKSLLHLACAKVASLIKGEPLDKIKAILTKDAYKNVVNKPNDCSSSSSSSSSSSTSSLEMKD